ncbi:MAG: YafY family transcriptional regulator [Alcaligenaceae bacterium]|nr:MAG: YafY family transcriptional regulator [Alcaligenaceae bacterium]
MSRSERLLNLLQVLRRHRRPVSAQTLADEVTVSVRTLYRDIASLKAQGAEIEGEAGIGYVLRPGFVLPPLMFRSSEVEALMLGLRWVVDRGDPVLAAGAREAATRIAAVLPAGLRRELETSALLVGAGARPAVDVVGFELLRTATRAGRKVRLLYRDKHDASSERVIWPFAVVYFEEARVLAGWCELRADFRNFRADRISHVELLDEFAPRSPEAMLNEWRRALQASGRKILPESDSAPF